MTVQGWLQIAVFLGLVVAIAPPLGAYLARVLAGERVLLAVVLGPVERGLYRLMRVDPAREQDWRAYARAVLLFSLAGWVALFAILSLQGALPLNPQGFGAAPWDVTVNTTSSFVTNTNWQYYAGETTLSNFSQMAGLAVQNFLSAAVGIAVAAAAIRGFSARSAGTLGSFWSDLVRVTLYVLAPIAFVAALVLASQGVVQSLAAPQGGIVVGPVASQEAIKLLGTNGGGFFNVNSAMPFENPSAFANVVELLLIVSIPAALPFAFGRMVGDRRQGRAIFAAMLGLFAVAVAVVYVAESHGSPAQQLAGIVGPGGNMEGKEVRNGVVGSSLFAALTTVTSTGAVNAAMESLTGLGSAVPLASMMTGEVVFGGVGTGLASMLLFVLLAVFLAGLMVGRTPEYLGRKIGVREIRLTVLGTLAAPLLVLVATAVAIGTRGGRVSLAADGPQGFSETLWAYTSQTNNNGSAFAGYTGFVQPNAPGNDGAFGIAFADLLGSGAMLLGRFLPILAVLAVAGALAGRRAAPAGPGTMRTDTATFALLLVGTIVLVALLTFVPALLLGPVVQALTDRML